MSATEDAAAFLIADNNTGHISVTLKDGTVNELISGTNCAGLQKNGVTTGSLEIPGATGSLKVFGTKYGAGIGGGEDGDGINIAISGGTVNAFSASNSCEVIGGGTNCSSCYNITITGGSIVCNSFGGAYFGCTPTDGNGNNVLLTKITLADAANTAVTGITGVTYGLTDVKTDASGVLYLYLPTGASVTAVKTTAHTYAGTVTAGGTATFTA